MDKKGARDEADIQWTFATWRSGDIIAQNRTDIAGKKRIRPIPPVRMGKEFAAAIGHPNGGGNEYRHSEYLEDGSISGRSNGTVGNGRNKWVGVKEYKPW